MITGIPHLLSLQVRQCRFAVYCVEGKKVLSASYLAARRVMQVTCCPQAVMMITSKSLQVRPCRCAVQFVEGKPLAGRRESASVQAEACTPSDADDFLTKDSDEGNEQNLFAERLGCAGLLFGMPSLSRVSHTWKTKK